MKKNLFYLFALICSMSLFTACSDDDEDNSWQKLPQGELIANDVNLQLNGEDATGTVNFKASGLESAQIGLKNLVDGYNDITVDVKMEKQSDGSFKLSGSKNITTKPVTRMPASPAALLVVNVDGSITMDGKLTLNVDASGAGLYIGTYTGEKLILSYGGNALIGKTVVFDATDGDNVSLLLTDVIPGENVTTLTGVSLNADGFSGTTTTANATVTYNGKRENKVLTLNLDVTMNNPSEWTGTYGLGDYSVGSIEFYGQAYSVVATSALYVDWQGIPDEAASLYAGLLRGLGGMLLPQVLKDVTFVKDGNIMAQYSSGTITMDPNSIMGMINGIVPSADDVNALIPSTGWLQSPKNLAFWYEKEGQLYVKLNIAGILGTAMGSDAGALSGIISTVLQSDPASIKGLLNTMLGVDFTKVSDETFATLLKWVNEGIPMDVKNADGHTYVYLNKDALSPLLKAYPTGEVSWDGEPETTMDIVQIWTALQEAGIIPKEYEAAGFLVAIIGAYYNMSTEFNLGLDLKK